jgi:hypothetical protein
MFGLFDIITHSRVFANSLRLCYNLARYALSSRFSPTDRCGVRQRVGVCLRAGSADSNFTHANAAPTYRDSTTDCQRNGNRHRNGHADGDADAHANSVSHPDRDGARG